MIPAGVHLTLYYNEYEQKDIAVKLDPELLRQLTGVVEHSDKPFSVMLASVGSKHNSIVRKRGMFKMRVEIAQAIAKELTIALVQAFGVNDELDGYKISKMSAEEITFYKSKGRL